MNFVKPGSRVVDVGADHAYLAIELIKSGRADFVIATDKNSGPVSAARRNILSEGLEKIIDVRQGDGLKVVRIGEIDTICIAGMGGGLIKKILSDSPEIVGAAKNLILQPMNAAENLQEYLISHGWFINDFELAEVDGIIYKTFFAERIFNPAQKKNSPLLKKYILQKIDRLKKILSEMSKSSAARAGEKFFAIQKEIKQLSEELEKLC